MEVVIVLMASAFPEQCVLRLLTWRGHFGQDALASLRSVPAQRCRRLRRFSKYMVDRKLERIRQPIARGGVEETAQTDQAGLVGMQEDWRLCAEKACAVCDRTAGIYCRGRSRRRPGDRVRAWIRKRQSSSCCSSSSGTARVEKDWCGESWRWSSTE